MQILLKIKEHYSDPSTNSVLSDSKQIEKDHCSSELRLFNLFVSSRINANIMSS